MKIRHSGVFLCVLFIGFLFATASCSTRGVTSDADKPDRIMSKAVKADQGVPEIEFFDSGSFDRKLSVSLRKAPQTIMAKFPATVTTNNIPERLDKWFFMVEKYEGAVRLEPEKGELAERGILEEAISLVIGAYNFMKEKAIYSPVKDYDAVVYYKPGTGTITKVVFTRRPAETEPEPKR